MRNINRDIGKNEKIDKGLAQEILVAISDNLADNGSLFMIGAKEVGEDDNGDIKHEVMYFSRGENFTLITAICKIAENNDFLKEIIVASAESLTDRVISAN